MGKHSLRWLLDRFFLESIGVSYDSVINDILSAWIGNLIPPLPRFENLIIKVGWLRTIFHQQSPERS